VDSGVCQAKQEQKNKNSKSNKEERLAGCQAKGCG